MVLRYRVEFRRLLKEEETPEAHEGLDGYLSRVVTIKDNQYLIQEFIYEQITEEERIDLLQRAYESLNQSPAPVFTLFL